MSLGKLSLLPTQTADVVIVGGGLLGLSCAYQLSRAGKHLKILCVEKEPKLLSLTSDASTGGFRNFYPQSPSMTRLANLSISKLQDLRNESNNIFEMVQNGYTFFSTNPSKINLYKELAIKAKENGTGPIYEQGTTLEEDGIHLFSDKNQILQLYPLLSKDVQVAMRVNKAGYLNVPKLGEYLFNECKKQNVEFVQGKVDKVNLCNGSIESIRIQDPLHHSQTIHAPNLVLAVGPYLKQMGSDLGLNLPVKNELHARVEIKDPLQIIPESSPFLIWSDDIQLPWTESEKNQLKMLGQSDEQCQRLLESISVPGIAGAHLRPLSRNECDGQRSFYGIWTYDNSQLQDSVQHPAPLPKHYDTVILRGLQKMIPEIRQYFPESNHPLGPLGSKTNILVKSGYYCKTPDNTPLLGQIKNIPGLFLCGGVSGFGVMCSQGAGYIVASQILSHLDTKYKDTIPSFADAFDPERYKHSVNFETEARTANQL